MMVSDDRASETTDWAMRTTTYRKEGEGEERMMAAVAQEEEEEGERPHR